MAWSLGQPHIPGDDGLEDLMSEEAAQISRYLFGERRSVVIHCKKHAFDLEPRVDRPSDPHMRVEELGDAFNRQILTLNRDQYRVGGSQGIQGQQVERRRTVNDDEGVFVEERPDRFLEPVLTAVH